MKANIEAYLMYEGMKGYWIEEMKFLNSLMDDASEGLKNTILSIASDVKDKYNQEVKHNETVLNILDAMEDKEKADLLNKKYILGVPGAVLQKEMKCNKLRLKRLLRDAVKTFDKKAGESDD